MRFRGIGLAALALGFLVLRPAAAEDLQKVPMNVQAITTEKLEQLHLKDFTDFQSYMPSVTFSSFDKGSDLLRGTIVPSFSFTPPAS